MVFLLLFLLLLFLFFLLLRNLILVLYNRSKKIGHGFDICENISVVHI